MEIQEDPVLFRKYNLSLRFLVYQTTALFSTLLLHLPSFVCNRRDHLNFKNHMLTSSHLSPSLFRCRIIYFVMFSPETLNPEQRFRRGPRLAAISISFSFLHKNLMTCTFESKLILNEQIDKSLKKRQTALLITDKQFC